MNGDPTQNLWSQNMLDRWRGAPMDERATFAQSLLDRYKQHGGNDIWGIRADHAQNFLDRYNQTMPPSPVPPGIPPPGTDPMWQSPMLSAPAIGGIPSSNPMIPPARPDSGMMANPLFRRQQDMWNYGGGPPNQFAHRRY
jgi:hypothetical protein